MASIYQSDLQSVDDESAILIIQLQLEDTEDLSSTFKGKHREDDSPDAEVALRLYKQELELKALMLSDRRMTQSIARAVQSDGVVLSEALSQEEIAARDQEMARNLTSSPDTSSLASFDVTTKERIDDELLAKMQALYVSGLEDVQFLSGDFSIYDGNNGEAESSSWAGSRPRNPSSISRRCEACREEKKFFDVARVPCRHEYCRDCLGDLFEASLTDESLFPPRCCRQLISVGAVRLFLKSELIHAYEKKKVEFETPNRTYCCLPRCSAFIPVENISDEVATCLDCGTTTCTTCKSATHEGDCPNDIALRQVLEAAAENGWQRCYSCWRLVELDLGCNHMTCRCGAQFCYVCGERWKNCSCERWDEHRLLARANQIVDRDPEPIFHDPAPHEILRAAEGLPGAEEGPHPQAIQVPPARDILIAQTMRDLLNNHECNHTRWRWVQGPHTCEECHHDLRQYIFECRQCQLQACNRCKRNRL